MKIMKSYHRDAIATSIEGKECSQKANCVSVKRSDCETELVEKLRHFCVPRVLTCSACFTSEAEGRAEAGRELRRGHPRRRRGFPQLRRSRADLGVK